MLEFAKSFNGLPRYKDVYISVDIVPINNESTLVAACPVS